MFVFHVESFKARALFTLRSRDQKTQWSLFNPLISKNDKILISPYNITPKSNVKVTRIKEMISS